MTRGLNPGTRVQRAEIREGVWQTPPKPATEHQEPPARYVAYGLLGLLVGLLLALAFVALVFGLLVHHRPHSADQARRDFSSPAPPLQVRPRETLHASIMAHRVDPAALRRAMAAVAHDGWGEDAAPPDRAATALARAEAAK